MAKKETPELKYSKKAEKAIEKVFDSLSDDNECDVLDALSGEFNRMSFGDANREDFLELGLELATELQEGETIFCASCPDGDAIYVRAKSEAELVRRIKALVS
jgi:hypothetical protein